MDQTIIHVDAGGWGLTWAADDAGRLHQIGAGPEGAGAEPEVDPIWYPTAHPAWGDDSPFLPAALRITHADGTTTTRLVLDGVDRASIAGRGGDRASDSAGASDGASAGDGAGEDITVRCRDERFDLEVAFRFQSHPDSAVLEQWVEVEHRQDSAITLHDVDSLALAMLVGPDASVTQFGGSGWADEWMWTTERLTPGTKVFDSLGGTQPHLQRSPMLMLEPFGPTTEHEGDVLGLSIAWGGNIRFALDVRPRAGQADRDLRVRAGANPLGADYVLDPGTRFVTPTVAWTWARGGRRELTRRFHAWTRARVLRDPDRLRPLVVNNWEATFFDFDEGRIVDLIGRAADLGADVFLLDDGWFATTHARNDDTSGLGDWQVNHEKLPGGLAALADAAREQDLRFGIWVEPEMVNPASELFEQHPDWVVRDGREPRLHRNQLMLDPLIEAVRDFEVDTVRQVLDSAPGTSYVKWDANRPVTDPGSCALPADRQSNLWTDQVHATWSVMRRVAEAHPDVDLMLCASGGGRNDHGTLRWFHEFWTSDNTDPVTRVRMQWACTHWFPASVVAAHVTAWGGRPLPFACAVALSGRFGFDLDLTALDDDTLDVCRRAVGVARRTQDLVQFGELERLVSPVADRPDAAGASVGSSTRAALAFHAVDRRRSVVFQYQLEATADAPPPLELTGLETETIYSATGTDLSGEPESLGSFTGAALADGALRWIPTTATSAWIVELTAVGPDDGIS